MSSAKTRRESLIASILRSTKGILAEILKSNMGKVGLVIVVFLFLTSMYALVTLPPDLPDKWNNVVGIPWIYYPKGAPPSWIRYLGFDEIETTTVALANPQRFIVVTERDITSNHPEYVKAIGVKALKPVGFTEKYVFEYNLDSSKTPRDLILVFKPKPTNEIQNKTITSMILLIVRPDGRIVEILEESSRILSLDPARPFKASDSKYCRVFIADYMRVFNLTGVSAEDLCRSSVKALFGEPRVTNGKVEFNTLRGQYRFVVIIAYSIPGMRFDDVRRYVESGTIGFEEAKVIVQGTVFGLLGTDIHGRDLLLGILFGFPVALAIGFIAAIVSVIIGLIIGVISGYYGGRVDEVIQRFIDVIVNIPLLPILVLIGYILQDPRYGVGPWARLLIIILIIALLGWGGLAIIVRSMTLSIKSELYIEAAKAIGAPTRRILLRHIIPQLIPYTVAVLVLSVPTAVLLEAGLNILGIRHGLPTWGLILSDAFRARGSAYWMWWWILPPGLLIAITSLAFVLLGFALEAMVEPRLRRR